MEKGDNLAFHLIQSFAPGETDPETAHTIGKALAKEFLESRHEYVLCTHLDKGHIHNHLIFCAANFKDYRKFISNRKSYYKLRKISDRLCEEQGLSIIQPGEEKGKSYKEYLETKKGTSWKAKLKETINKTLPRCSTYEEFLLQMEIQGYEIKEGKYLSFRAQGQKRFTRSKTLGYGYTIERIKEKIERGYAKDLFKKTQKDMGLLIDLSNSIKAMESPGYAHVLKIQNIKNAAKTLNYLTEEGIDSYSILESKIRDVKRLFDESKEEIKRLENRITDLSLISKHLKTLKQVELIRKGRKNDPSVDLDILEEAALSHLKGQGLSRPFPDLSKLLDEIEQLHIKKDRLYEVYDKAKDEWKKIRGIKSNVDYLIDFNLENDIVFQDEKRL